MVGLELSAERHLFSFIVYDWFDGQLGGLFSSWSGSVQIRETYLAGVSNGDLLNGLVSGTLGEVFYATQY